MMTPLAPARDEIHVWYLFSTSFPARLDSDALALLSSNERERYARFRAAETRREYLLTRALVRCTLSRYGTAAPQEWRFEAGPGGRPRLAPGPQLPLHFNLSNSASLIACVVGWEAEIGIDVEAIAGNDATLALARRYFSPAEVCALDDLPAQRRLDRFFELWTLKESYLKARSLGLQVPLAQVSFQLNEDATLTGEENSWQFNRLFPSTAHRVATAVRRRTCTKLRIVERTMFTLDEGLPGRGAA